MEEMAQEGKTEWGPQNTVQPWVQVTHNHLQLLLFTLKLKKRKFYLLLFFFFGVTFPSASQMLTPLIFLAHLWTIIIAILATCIDCRQKYQ